MKFLSSIFIALLLWLGWASVTTAQERPANTLPGSGGSGGTGGVVSNEVKTAVIATFYTNTTGHQVMGAARLGTSTAGLIQVSVTNANNTLYFQYQTMVSTAAASSNTINFSVPPGGWYKFIGLTTTAADGSQALTYYATNGAVSYAASAESATTAATANNILAGATLNPANGSNLTNVSALGFSSNPTNIIYVEANGSDANSGRIGQPKATVTNAIANATANTLIKVGVGTFSARANMPHNVSIQGSGRGQTIMDVGNGQYGFIITNGNHFSDFTIISSPTPGSHGFPFSAINQTVPVTNCSLTRVYVQSKTDVMSLLAKTNWFKASDCDFVSSWDNIIIQGLDTDGSDRPQGYIEFNNCRWLVYYDAVYNAGGQTIALQTYERTVLNGCTITVSNSPTFTYGLMTGTAGNVTLNNCTINTTSTNGTVWKILNENVYGNTEIYINGGNIERTNISSQVGVNFYKTSATVPTDQILGTLPASIMPTNYALAWRISPSVAQPSSVTWEVVTNAVVAYNNGFNVNAAAGLATNVYAGWYAAQCRLNLTPPADITESWRLTLFKNTAILDAAWFDERVALQGDILTEAVGIQVGQMSLNLSTITYLPAGTRIDVRLCGPAVNNTVTSGELNLVRLH